nr:GLPGLI family protein [uncultured Flavobacterium sp.]
MNKILLLICVVFSQMVWAQTNDYKITYKRFEGNRKRDAVLYVKENQPTVMHDIIKSTAPIKVIKDTTYISENGATVMKSGTGKIDYSIYPDEYMKIDQATHKIEMIRNIFKKNFLVTDQINYSWKITNETKQIQNFTCYKATTAFRGNTFEAWFTPDIPINAGPWKWYGLPGLILEATDKDQSVVFKVEKIEKLTEEIPFPSRGLTTVTLQQYFIKGKEADDALMARMNTDRNFKVTTTVLGRFGLERLYEWEEEAKK